MAFKSHCAGGNFTSGWINSMGIRSNQIAGEVSSFSRESQKMWFFCFFFRMGLSGWTRLAKRVQPLKTQNASLAREKKARKQPADR